jgi:heme/copper-type cytochrome/quinol oxidase subunit 1
MEQWFVARTHRLGLAQRIVIVVALGLALAVIGSFVSTLGEPQAQFGWFGYAPLTAPDSGADLSAWQQLLVWIGLIGVWAAASLKLLGRPARP